MTSAHQLQSLNLENCQALRELEERQFLADGRGRRLALQQLACPTAGTQAEEEATRTQAEGLCCPIRRAHTPLRTKTLR